MKFCSLVLELHLPQNFCHTHTDTQTDRQTNRHFPEIVKSCSGHPKTCKFVENRKSKICTKPMLSSTYTEESNNYICSALVLHTALLWSLIECWLYHCYWKFIMWKSIWTAYPSASAGRASVRYIGILFKSGTGKLFALFTIVHSKIIFCVYACFIKAVIKFKLTAF